MFRVYGFGKKLRTVAPTSIVLELRTEGMRKAGCTVAGAPDTGVIRL